MDSPPRQSVRRERRRHYAREALGIGYQSFDVELPAWMNRTPAAMAADSQKAPDPGPDPAATYTAEASVASICRQAFTQALTLLIFVFSLLVVFVFLVRGYSLLCQFLNSKGGSMLF